MRYSSLLVFALVIISACAVAGCTQSASLPAPSNGTAAASPASSENLSAFILSPSELPAGFSLVSGRAKYGDEVSSLARQLGWQGGYEARYAKVASGANASSAILQTITIYPADQIPQIAKAVSTEDQQEQGSTYTSLPAPATGSSVFAFRKTNTTTGSGFAEVIFTRGNVLEVIRISGPAAENDTLAALAETAYARLP